MRSLYCSSLYLPTLLSGAPVPTHSGARFFMYILTHSAVSLFSANIFTQPSEYSSHLPSSNSAVRMFTVSFLFCQFSLRLYPLCWQVLPALYTLLSVFSLHLSTVLSGVPVPTHSAVRCPCTYPLCCQVSLYLPTLLSGVPVPTYPLCGQIVPVPTHSAVRFFMYLLTHSAVLCNCPLQPETIPRAFQTLLSGCSLHLLSSVSFLCAHPLCCQATPCTLNFTVRFFPGPVNSAVRCLSTPLTCCPCTYIRCTSQAVPVPTHFVVRFPSTYPL
jgi:hypothetical protein